VGGGVEQVIGLAEAPDAAAEKLLAVTASPQLVGVRVFGDAVVDTAARTVADAYAGSPARVPVRLRPEGGYLTLVGQAPRGTFEKTIAVPALAAGEGDARFAALFARERVEDLEASRHVGREVDDEVERLGVDFQIATRQTSWVAVSDDPTVDPTEPTRAEVMPHALPSGISPDGVLGAAMMMDTGTPDFSAVASAELFRALPRPSARGGRARSEVVEVCRRPGTGRDASPFGPSSESMDSLEVPATEDELSAEAEIIELTGEVVFREDGRLVVQSSLREPIDWMRPKRWTVLLADGCHAQVELDFDVSTRPGALEAGVVLRVAFRGVPEGAVVEARGGGYRIAIERA
jgi:Ca-activated chloride channel family protein